MRRVNSIHHIPDVVLDIWKQNWNDKTGFEMLCGESRYYVPPSQKYDMWVYVRSSARSPRLRGRVSLPKDYPLSKAGQINAEDQSK